MPPLDFSILSLISNAAVAGAVLALVLLAVEYRAPNRAARWTLALGLGLSLAAAMLLAVGSGWELTAPLACLGAIAIVAAIVRLEAVRRLIARLLQPALVWCLVLAASVAAALYVPLVPPPIDDDLPVPPATSFHQLEGLVGVTDLGRELSLCAYDPSSSLLEAEKYYLALEQYRQQLIRLAPPGTDCNCHGWVYTGGKYAVRGFEVPAILEDNGYAPVNQPRAGDLVIYSTPTGEVAHTGVVRLVMDDGSAFVESKWGPLGVYLHPLLAQPYGERHAFYRSPRGGHVVQVLPSESAAPPEAALPAAALAGTLAPPAETSDSLLTAVRGRGARPAERPVLRVPGQRKT